MDNLRITSFNVRGMNNNVKRKCVFRMLKDKKQDIVCIQESYITSRVFDQWKKEWGGEMVYCEGTNHGRGQIILMRKGFPYDFTECVNQDRILGITFKTENKSFSIFNVYAPCRDRETKDFLLHLKNVISLCDSEHKIVCGDFNAVLDNNLDIISGERHATSVVDSFNNLTHDCDLHDVWRVFNRDLKEYSWSRRTRDTFIARRLDYILINREALDITSETNFFSVPSSDHRGICIELKITENERGPGYFKFNNSLLKNQDFVLSINNLIDNFLDDHQNIPAVEKWELLKTKMQDEAIQCSRQLAIKKRNRTILLSKELNETEASLASNPNNKVLQNRIHDLKIQIELNELERLKSAQVRSKIKWIDEGEKNTRYFLNLEKSRANRKLFPNLELDDGTTVVDQFEILKGQREYYTNLYNKQLDDENMTRHADNFTEDCAIPRLTDEDKEKCEGQITIEEATNCIKGMKNGSSPGLDGMTTEFLKFFWLKIRDVVVQSFNESFTNGSLSYRQKLAVITLIHKGKDLPKNKLGNWRPISLTNTDYKLLAKILATRLSKVIEKVINRDQVGYIKGRHVSTTLRTIDDIIEFYRLKEKPGILLALDFQKAFDSISKPYMLYAFKKFGFGESFIKWVQVLFSDTKSCMIYNGWISESFQVNNGIRQGCPFSPLAFIVGVELLALKIRHSEACGGIDITADKILRVLLYADDITVFVKNRNNVRILLAILDRFSQFSGLRLNKQKSEAMGIGSLRNANYGLEIKWVNQIKILGIHFSSSESASKIELNWKSKLVKIRQQISNWERRNLGLMGKICVIKTILLSQFIYVMQAICLPEHILREINTILYRFLWRKKNCNLRAFEKVKRVVVNSDTDKGGLKMIDVAIMQDSFLCRWLKTLTTTVAETKWTWIPSIVLKHFGRGGATFSSTVGPKIFKGLNDIKSVFWKETLRAWLTHNKQYTSKSVKMTCIWNNHNIQYLNNVIHLNNWAKNGITFIHDLLEDNTLLSFPEIEAKIGPSPSLYLEYRVVYAAVSAYLRNNPICRTEPIIDNFVLMFNDKNIVAAKEFRNYIVTSKYSTPCAVLFWKHRFNIDIGKQHWEILKTSKESRLRELHWKILHNIYPTNILLLKMGLANSEYCTWCRVEVDYIEHFFYNCPKIHHLWKHVENIFYLRWDTKLVLNVQMVLTGIVDRGILHISNIQLRYINHLIQIGKMCISKFRYGTPTNILIMFDSEVRLRQIV